eukprot:COSAG01_NODE_12439_length_1738_cov_3.407317_2_plen_65_part_00
MRLAARASGEVVPGDDAGPSSGGGAHGALDMTSTMDIHDRLARQRNHSSRDYAELMKNLEAHFT